MSFPNVTVQKTPMYLWLNQVKYLPVFGRDGIRGYILLSVNKALYITWMNEWTYAVPSVCRRSASYSPKRDEDVAWSTRYLSYCCNICFFTIRLYVAIWLMDKRCCRIGDTSCRGWWLAALLLLVSLWAAKLLAKFALYSTKLVDCFLCNFWAIDYRFYLWFYRFYAH